MLLDQSIARAGSRAWFRTRGAGFLTDPIEAIAFYGVFVFAVTVHEASHALAAKLGGDLTAYNGGQVSLDPVPHMKREPFGMVILPIMSVAMMGWPLGYASAPYDPRWARRYPKRAAWMALAGPAANLGLVIVAALLIRIGMSFEIFEAPSSIHFSHVTAAVGDPTGLAAGGAFLLSIFFSLNLLLFVLNMIPVPPLDGSGALPLILPDQWLETYRRLIHQPMIGLIGIVIVWNFVGEIFWPFLLFSIGLLYPGVQYG
jgi:Zn-dependent protease